MKKVLKSIVLVIISIALLLTILIFEIKDWPAGSSIAGIFTGFSLPALWFSLQDIFDDTDWKNSQRKLERGKLIQNDTIIRISFAYLYRIKVDDKYLLVKNERGTGKYQPVGGVYKFYENEKMLMKNLFQIKDDDKISIDNSSRNDYRLRLENKYLRKFIKHFDKRAEREKIYNLSREFEEEIVEKEILDWNQISYRYCGRHMTTVKFSEHFQTYELLLADIVELILTEEQEADLRLLMENENGTSLYCFATAEEIVSLGVDTKNNRLAEVIADHTKKIIQEEEGKLMKVSYVGEQYTVNLRSK